MNEQQKKNRRTIKIIFAMSIIPFGIAWILSSNSLWMGGGTNNGKLITPPLTTEANEVIGFDDFSKKNIKELQGHWILINLLPSADCNTICQEAIHKTKQLRVMMGKDLTRIRRLAIVMSEVDESLAQQWWKDDPRLLRSKPTPSLVKKLKKIIPGDIPEGLLLLMDPMGNLMMLYEPKFDPYDVKNDLKKLLKISQIG